MAHRISVNVLSVKCYSERLISQQDIKKLLSLELTGAWINEAREVPRSLINGLLMPLGVILRCQTADRLGMAWLWIRTRPMKITGGTSWPKSNGREDGSFSDNRGADRGRREL